MGAVYRIARKTMYGLLEGIPPGLLGLAFIGALCNSLTIGIIVGIILFAVMFIDSWLYGGTVYNYTDRRD